MHGPQKILQKTSAKGLTFPDFKIYYKAVVIITDCTGIKTDMEENRTEVDPLTYGQKFSPYIHQIIF
jgi:hypothetical protein